MHSYKVAWYRLSGSSSKFEDEKECVCEIVIEVMGGIIHAMRLAVPKKWVVGLNLPAITDGFDAWKLSAQRMASVAGIGLEIVECEEAGYYVIFEISPIYLSQPYPDPVMLDLRRACWPIPIKAVNEMDALLKFVRLNYAYGVTFKDKKINNRAKMLVCQCTWLKALHYLVAKNVKDFSD